MRISNEITLKGGGGMLIADDIKTLFNYIENNNLLNEKTIYLLTNHEESRNKFSSGRFPILLKLDPYEDLILQRKFNTQKTRYYSTNEIEQNFKGAKFFLTNNIYKDQRDKYYRWFLETFKLNLKRF